MSEERVVYDRLMEHMKRDRPTSCFVCDAPLRPAEWDAHVSACMRIAASNGRDLVTVDKKPAGFKYEPPEATPDTPAPGGWPWGRKS